MVNSPLIRPYLLGGWHRGVTLGSHDENLQLQIWLDVIFGSLNVAFWGDFFFTGQLLGSVYLCKGGPWYQLEVR